MNILLVYPRFPATFWSYTHALKFIGKKAVSPPLGLLTVAALLPHSFDAKLVDLNITPLTDADLHWADFVFLSAMAVQEPSARQVMARCRTAGVPVVAGGPLFTSQPDAFPQADHLVLNEAEITLPLFLADLAKGNPARRYATSEFADLRQSPRPRFELADLRRYAVMPLQFSRGCPFDCEFCDVTVLFGHKPRVKSPSQIIRELDRFKSLRWKGPVFFVDDNLIGNKRHLKEDLLPALIDWQKRSGPVPFNSQVSMNLADDPELIDLLARAGFSSVFIGIETPDSETLAACNKRQNVNCDMLAGVHRIQKAGIQVQGGFILGFDHDAPSIFQRQIDFIQSSGISTAMVGLLQALPGTRLHNRLKVLHRINDQPCGDNVAGSSNIVPLMDAETLRLGYFRVMKTLYSPRGYYRRLRTFLRNYQSPRIRERPRFTHFRAFLRSLFMLGIVGRERCQYWYLLTWTTFRRPSLFSTAIHLAILGRHYRLIWQRMRPAT